MRILLLCHAFNSLAQRLYVELADRGHEVSVELDIHEDVTVEALDLFRPDLVVAPFLKRRIPESIWRRLPCLVVHPGIRGDRGPSALDWAIARGEQTWGVTVIQANAELDAGDIWAAAEFPMREASKSSLYRREVADAAARAVLRAIAAYQAGTLVPEKLDYCRPDVRGRWQPLMRQADRAIDWEADDTRTVLCKIRAADSSPGVLDRVGDRPVYLFGAHAEDELRGKPGEFLARRDGAVCRATRDGAVWIAQLREPGEFGLKLPATMVLERLAAPEIARVPEVPLPLDSPRTRTWREIWYCEAGAVGYLAFEFYNGAMSTSQCRRLLAAYRHALSRPTRVLVLLGGSDFWSNGIHLGVIEAAESPADESWANIEAMNDLARAIIETDDRLVVAALRGNAAAGGVFLALAADRVLARDGVVLNPHYKSMGNLYGSEYWTYLLPRRVGERRAAEIVDLQVPISARRARELGLIDVLLDGLAESGDGLENRRDGLAEGRDVRASGRDGLAEGRDARASGWLTSEAGEALAGAAPGGPKVGGSAADDDARLLALIAAEAEALARRPDYEALVRAKRERRYRDEAEKPLAAYREAELERMRQNFYGFDPSYHVARYNFVFKIPHSRTPASLAVHRPARRASGPGPSPSWPRA